MAETIHCDAHGTSTATFICQHLLGSDQGFHCAEDTEDPRPDAWCDACEEVLNRTGEWNDDLEAFAGFKLVCSECYDNAKHHNCKRNFTFLCNHCTETHHGVPGIGWNYPVHYLDIPEAERDARVQLTPSTCVLDGKYFFIRGTLTIPVKDASESLIFGAWLSLSEANFRRYQEIITSPDQDKEEPMFGWLCSAIRGYPDTLSLKARAWFCSPELKPSIELEPTDHPLAIQQRQGITMATLATLYEQFAPGMLTALTE